MISNSGEYILVDFTAEELELISERAEGLIEMKEMQPFWQQAHWQLSLAANHLSMLLQREKGNGDKILEDYEQE